MTDSMLSAAPTVLVLASQEFGRSVGEKLRQRKGAHVHSIDQDGPHPGFWPHADLLVLATGYERPRLCELVDRVAFNWGRPWFAVHANATTIVAGPVVVPGRSACYQCFGRRRAQHQAADGEIPPEVEFAYLGMHADLAAALAEQAIEEIVGGSGEAATVRTYDDVTGGMSRNGVIAVNRCRRCRPLLEHEDRSPLWLSLTEAGYAIPAVRP